MCCIFINPFKLNVYRYSRNSVSPRMSTGVDVIQLLRRVLYKDIDIAHLTYLSRDVLKITKLGGIYYVLDGHKRLFVLKTLEKIGWCDKIWANLSAMSVCLDLTDYWDLTHYFRRPWSRWNSTSTIELSEGKEIEFLSKNHSDNLSFQRRVKEVVEECLDCMMAC